MLKRIIKYVLLLVLLASMAFLYSFTNRKNANKLVKEIEINFSSNEPYFLTKSIVNKLLIQNNEEVQKQAKSVINLYMLEEKLSEHPYIEKVSLFITIDDRLKAVVKQRQPIARVITSNSSYYIDLNAIKVPLSENYSARVPIITGIENENNLKNVVKLLKEIVNDDFLRKEITGIHFQTTKEYMMTVRSGSYKIEFGELNMIDHKIKKLKAFYSKVFLDSTINKYKTINIKYHNQVVGVK